MKKLLDDGDYIFRPEHTQGHQSVLIGAGFFIPYIPPGSKTMLVQAVAKDIRYTLDGTAPTGVIGFSLTAGDVPILIDLGGGAKPQFFGSDAAASLQYCYGT